MATTIARATFSDGELALLRGRNWGIVTTLRADGSPHSTPVWVDTDGEHVLFNTAIGRAKERHLRRDPRVSLAVLPAENPQAGYVSVSGTAELDEAQAEEHIHALARKYLGQERYPWLQPGGAPGDRPDPPAADRLPGRVAHYSSKRRKTTQALWPPKPKLFETATLTSASRASFGT